MEKTVSQDKTNAYALAWEMSLEVLTFCLVISEDNFGLNKIAMH